MICRRRSQYHVQYEDSLLAIWSSQGDTWHIGWMSLRVVEVRADASHLLESQAPLSHALR